MDNEYFFKPSDFLRVMHGGKWHYFEPRDNDHADQIFEYHYKTQNQIRKDADVAMRVTGCFRPKSWERERGRKGDSQHCFIDHDFHEGIGATDSEPWYSRDNNEKVFLKIANSSIDFYQRTCFYPLEGFFHNDYKAGAKQRFVCTYKFDANRDIWVQDSWEYVDNHDDWEKLIKEQWNKFENARSK